MAAHAKLGASNAHRWMACPGSVQMEAGLPNTSSPHAQEGTLAHELAELCLKHNMNAIDLPDENDREKYPQEMRAYVQEYLDYVRDVLYAAGSDAVLDVEVRIDYSRWVPGGFGTADAVIYNARGDMWVIDLKYGVGVKNYAEGNPQAMLYALGAVDKLYPIVDIEKVTLVIHQPRLDDVDEHVVSAEELMQFAEDARRAAEKTQEPNADLIPGEKQCRWCKAKASCPAMLRQVHEIVGQDFDSLSQPDKLTDQQLSNVLEHKKLITDWLGAVEDHARGKLESGQPFPGYKLVAGRSLRQWQDLEAAEQKLSEILGDSAYERKLLTPAKAEKALGKHKDALAEYIVKPEGKPTLVPEKDKRPAINIGLDDFDGLS